MSAQQQRIKNEKKKEFKLRNKRLRTEDTATNSSNNNNNKMNRAREKAGKKTHWNETAACTKKEDATTNAL